MSTPQRGDADPRLGRLRTIGRVVAAAGMVAVLAVIFAGALSQHRAPSALAQGPSPAPAAASPPLAAGLATTPAAVPWAALATPSPTPTPTAVVTVPACTVGDLSASPLTWAGVGAGSEYISATISLRSSAPCYLPSTPPATLLDASGDPLSVAAMSGPSSGPLTLTPAGGPATVLLMIGDHAAVPVPATLSITLAGGDQLTLQVAPSSFLPVDTPSPGTGPGPAADVTWVVSISVPGAAPPMPTVLPGIDMIGVSLADGGAATPGQPFDYAVTLSPCPTYIEGLKGSSSIVTFQLNCAEASPIPPGGSETFEMQLPIAASTAAGPWDLVWGIQGGSTDGNLPVTAS